MSFVGALPEPNDCYPVVSPDRYPPAILASKDHLRHMGVPEDWLLYCEASPLVGEGAAEWSAHIAVGGNAPRRSLDELLRAVRLGLGLNLHLESGFDLSSIVSVLREVVDLSIGSRGSLTGWGALSQASHLQKLTVGPPPSEPLEVKDLPLLKRFIGNGRNSVFAVQNPNLERVLLSTPSWPRGVSIAGPVRYLQIAGARRVSEAPVCEQPDELTTLRVHSTARFDLASVVPLRNLETLWIDPCRKIENVRALLEMKRLDEFQLGGIKEMPEWRLLEQVNPRRLMVSDNHVIPSSAAERLAISHPHFHIAPKKPGDDDKAKKLLSLDDDGLDEFTFAPITIREHGEPDNDYSLFIDMETLAIPGKLGMQVEQVLDWVTEVAPTALTSGAAVPSIDEAALELRFASLRLLVTAAARIRDGFAAQSLS